MLARIFFLATLSLSVFLLPALAWGDAETWRKESGSAVLDNQISPGECLYVRPTSTGQSEALVAMAIARITFDLNCNLEGTETDCAVEIWWCPEGQTTYSATACKPIWFEDGAGTAVKVLDGDDSAGTASLWGPKMPRYHVNSTTVPGGNVPQVQACMDGGEKTPGTLY